MVLEAESRQKYELADSGNSMRMVAQRSPTTLGQAMIGRQELEQMVEQTLQERKIIQMLQTVMVFVILVKVLYN